MIRSMHAATIFKKSHCTIVHNAMYMHCLSVCREGGGSICERLHV